MTILPIEDSKLSAYIVLDENGNFYAKTLSSFNARLISNGPALLQALKNVLGHGSTFNSPEGRNAAQQAFDVINTIEGRTASDFVSTTTSATK